MTPLLGSDTTTGNAMAGNGGGPALRSDSARYFTQTRAAAKSMTLQEIGDSLRTSRERVRQFEAQALARIAADLKDVDEGPEED